MPGDERGDRVHNFFAQDNTSQGQHQSHVLGGNWAVPNNNFWVDSQRQTDALNPSSRVYPAQNSEIERGQTSYPVHASHNGLNFSQSNLKPDISKSQLINEQQYSNGVVYGNQLYQNRQGEANFLAMDTDSNHSHQISSRRLSIQEAQRESSHDQQEKAFNRLETSVTPMSFDLFGGQPQMNHQQASMLHALQRQQSGLNDMQQMQQQFMIRKMQESQLQQQQQQQQQLRQLDLRPQNLSNQVPPFSKQTLGSLSSNLANGSSNSDSLQYPWTADPGTNWLNRSSSVMHGSPGELGFPPNLSQTHHLMDLMPQQADQSLYGVPVSSSRGLAVNQYPQMVMGRSSMPHASTFSNSLHGGQHNFLLDQTGGQDFTSISGLKSQNENIGHAPGQSLSTGIADRPPLQQMNLMQKNASPQPHFSGRQELATQSETSNEQSTRQVSSSPNDVALDPTEEKILFGSDDNLWSAFGKSSDMSGEASNLFNNAELSNGFPSLQSGSWSALMQSAVAETSSADIGPQEEWSGLNLHNADGPSENQLILLHNDYIENTSLPNDDQRIPSATNSGSIRSSEDIHTTNVVGSNQLGHKFQNEPGIRVSTDTSQRFKQSLDESNKWSNRSLLQKSIAERSQIYGNAPQHTLDADKTAEKVSATWVPGKTGNKLEQNGWNVLAAGPPGGDRVLNNNDEAELSRKSPNNRLMEMQGGLPGSSSWKSNSVTSSTNEFGPFKDGKQFADKGRLSLNDASAAVANSCNTGVGDGTRSFIQNNNLLHQWNSARPPTKFQEREDWGGMQDQVNEHNQGLDPLSRGGKDEVRRHDAESCAMKENSNDSDHSNLLHHASGRFREAGLSDANDSRSLPPGKQKLTNQIATKVSVPRKFQYHPLGNLDEDVESTFGMKRPTSSSMQNTQFGQSSAVSRYSSVKDKGELPKDSKGTNEEHSLSSFSGSAPRMHFPFNRTLPNKASSPGQNMLELLHKVDQSRNDGDVQHPISDGNLSSQTPEAENSDESAGRIQRGQSFVSKGFGLQLGPPSQRLHIPDPQNARGTSNSVHTSHADAEMGEKMLQTSSGHSFPFPNEGSQYQNDGSSVSGYPADEKSLYSAPVNHHLACSSDTLYARSQLQNKQISRGIEKIAVDGQMNSSSSGNTSHPAQRGKPGASDLQGRSLAAAASTRDRIHSSQDFGAPSISRQGGSRQVLQSMWSNPPSSQHQLAAQYLKSPSHLSAQPQQNIVESSIYGNLHVNKGGHLSSELNAIHLSSRGVKEEASFVNIDLASKVEEPSGKASSIKDNMEDSPANSASTQKDIEAFGRSLKPNAFSSKNSALPNQMKGSKDAQTDQSIRDSKRIKGSDTILNEHNVGDMLASSAGVSSEDSGMFSPSSPSDIMQRNTFPHGNIASRDIVAAGLDASQNNSSDFSTYVKNHQVAPSWFNQHGPFTNGQFLPVQDALQVSSLRPDETPSTLKSSSIFGASKVEENITATLIGAGQVGCNLDFAPTSVSHEHLSSVQSLQMDVTGQHQVISRPLKRKSATSELHPWHKEISDGSRNILVLSVAEGGWSKAGNCLYEKVQDNVDLVEDGSPLLRSKRRLTLTRQLMQQLFRPPPMTILSADDSSAYEGVTYAVSRVALGDACSAVARSSDLGHHDSIDQLVEMGKLHGNPRFAKVIEDLLGKTRKLEDDLLRLDKSASLLDLRVECQDLEKFSVINRFARFHGRGQPDVSEASSTSQNPHLQRYATAVAPPRNFPDGVQCLSL